jgi:hypothetical protein
MPLTALRYEALAVVGRWLAKLHLGGGCYRYSADNDTIEASPDDDANRRFAIVLEKTPTPHPLTGSYVQHAIPNARTLCRDRTLGRVIAGVEEDDYMVAIARSFRSATARTSGIFPLPSDELGGRVVGSRMVDRTYRNSPPGFGVIVDAGVEPHAVSQHTITQGTTTHTIDFSLGAGGIISQWRTVDSALSVDQQHISMGVGDATTMGFGRGIGSSLLAYHDADPTQRYSFNPRQGGDLWSASMAGAWHTPPPTVAHVLLSGGSPTIRFEKTEAGGETIFDITTVPLDWDPDGRYWSWVYNLPTPQSMYAGAGYGKPAVCLGTLLHTRWTFMWNGHPNIHKCEVFWDLADHVGDVDLCELMPSMQPGQMHLRAGLAVNDQLWAYDGLQQLQTSIHDTDLWPDADETLSLVLDREAFAIRDPYTAHVPYPVRSGFGGAYFRSTGDGSCFGVFQRMANFGDLDAMWGLYVTPWNDDTADPDRFQDPHHKIGPVVGDSNPRLVIPAAPFPKGVRGPYWHFVLTGDQDTVEANMRLLASSNLEDLQRSYAVPFR